MAHFLDYGELARSQRQSGEPVSASVRWRRVMLTGPSAHTLNPMLIRKLPDEDILESLS